MQLQPAHDSEAFRLCVPNRLFLAVRSTTLPVHPGSQHSRSRFSPSGQLAALLFVDGEDGELLRMGVVVMLLSVCCEGGTRVVACSNLFDFVATFCALAVRSRYLCGTGSWPL